MGGGRVYGGSNMTAMFQNDRLPCSPEVLESLWIPNSSPSFHGDSRSCSTSMVNFEDIRVGNPTIDRPFFPPLEEEKDGKEDYDSSFHHQPEKKRRLTADQVQSLERNFVVENKLEPERKVQLAKELGLQPRQVAIWFQNRRARFKTKQLEKEYDSLKASYDKLNADYDSLLNEKERLKNEVCLLTEKLLLREKESTISKQTRPINPVTAEEPQMKTTISDCENKSEVPMVFCKQDDVSSAKSDVSDSDSLNCASGNHCSLLEPADSSVAFGPDQSDFSQDDEDELTRTLLPLPFQLLPKLEEGCYSDPSANCCNWSFQDEGGQPSWLWPY